jgi:hypothetical protein
MNIARSLMTKEHQVQDAEQICAVRNVWPLLWSKSLRKGERNQQNSKLYHDCMFVQYLDYIQLEISTYFRRL